MDRIIKKRSASKNVVQGLVVKINDMIGEENKRHEVERMVQTIEVKMAAIQQLNDTVLDDIAEDQMENEMESATLFEIDIMKEIDRFKEKLSAKVKVEPSIHEVAKEERGETLPSLSSSKYSVRLPKIEIKKFHGDPVQWQQFADTFDATITSNEHISDVEKFTYLRGFLEGEAERCIEGITLIGENFSQAMGLLRQRYGNPQLIISAHMEKLFELERISGSRASIKDLRNLYDRIESHLRSLLALGINSEQYGPMLIPLIVNKIPNDIRLEISRKLGTENWKSWSM